MDVKERNSTNVIGIDISAEIGDSFEKEIFTLGGAMVKENDYYELLGKDIRTYREKAGLTQAELAEAAGLARTSLINIERGRQRVFVDQLETICQEIGLSVAEFFDKRGRLSKPKPVVKSNLKGMPMVAKFLDTVRRDEET